MSFIEGVGDEVIAFAVILLLFILAATITFIFNSSPFVQQQGQVPTSPETASSQSSEQHRSDTEDENHSQDNSRTTLADSDLTAANATSSEEKHSATSESETAGTSDNVDVSSENAVNSSSIYPDVSEISPSAPDIESEESNVESENTQPTDPDQIHVRLKYLDDTERTVSSNLRVKIGDFKRLHFPEEFASNKLVRLIFGGQLLRDNETLRSYAIANNCVIHVQILQAQAHTSPTHVSQNTDLDLSHLLWPLLSVILGICWILYFKYPEFFNLMSLGMLFLFTGSFIYFYSQIQHQ